MRTVAPPDYRSVSGNLAAHVLRREDGEVAHCLTLTFWESLEAVSAFARDEVSAAKYCEFDKDFLLELEPGARQATGRIDRMKGDLIMMRKQLLNLKTLAEPPIDLATR